MSDWKSRATPVAGEWKTRAKPVEHFDPLDGETAEDRGALLAPSTGETKPDAVQDALKPTSTTGAIARGATEGVTYGFGDEAMGAMDTTTEASHRARQAVGLEQAPMRDAVPAVNPTSPHIAKSWEGNKGQSNKDFLKEQNRIIPEQAPEEVEQPSLIDTYRKARDSYRKDNEASEAAHPLAYGASEVVSNLAVPVPGPKGAGLLSRIGSGATHGLGMGIAMGAGKSNADITSGDGRQTGAFLADVGQSGALGMGGGAIGGAISHAGSSLAERFSGKAVAAEQRAQEMVEQKAMKAFKSAVGSLGGEVSAGRNAIDVLKEAIANPNATAQQVSAAQSLLDDPESIELVQRVYKNAINRFPSRLGGIQAAERGVVDAAEANTPRALDEAKDELLSNPIKKRLWPRVKTQLINRALMPAIGAAGGAGTAEMLGLDPEHGAYVGGAIGVGANALIGGRASSAWEKMMGHPGMQKFINEGLASGSEGLGDAFGKWAPVIAAERTPEARQALATKAIDEDPSLEARIQAVLDKGAAEAKARPTLQKRFSGKR